MTETTTNEQFLDYQYKLNEIKNLGPVATEQFLRAIVAMTSAHVASHWWDKIIDEAYSREIYPSKDVD